MSAQVYVYFNITRQVWSVAEAKGNGRGKLIEHRKALTLRDARFVVSEASRQSCIAGGQRQVHAGVIGTLVDYVQAPRAAAEITYRPFLRGEFYNVATREAVTTAANVSFAYGSRHAWAW